MNFLAQAKPEDIIGTVNTSVGILKEKAIDTDTGQLLGVMTLMNSILKVIFVIGGLWAFINFIIAGYGFISAGGDSKAMGKSWERIWQSFMGLLFIVGSFLLAAIAGVLLFHDATAILQPKLK